MSRTVVSIAGTDPSNLPSGSTVVTNGTASATATASGIRLRTSAINSDVAFFLPYVLRNGYVTWNFTLPANLSTLPAPMYTGVNARASTIASPTGHTVTGEADFLPGLSGSEYIFDDAGVQLGTQGTPTAANSALFGARFEFIGFTGYLTVWSITGGQDETTGSTISFEGLTYQTPGYIQFFLASDASGSAVADLLLTNITIVEYTGPWVVAQRGTLANVTAGTNAVTLTNPTLIAVGNMLVMVEAVDNSGTNGAAPPLTSITDTRNTWTVRTLGLADPGAAAAGVQAYAATAPVRVAYQAADTVTPVYTASPTAKAIRIYEVANVDLDDPLGGLAAVTSTGTATATVTTGPITPPRADMLIVAVTALEGPNADTITTEDADSLEGFWHRGTGLGSTDATATNNQKVFARFKPVIAFGAPSAQTLNITLGTARDWAGGVFALQSVQHIPAPIITRHAVCRASTW